MQLYHDAQRHNARLPRAGMLLGGLAAVLTCGALSASSARAGGDFGDAFERELGRAVAQHIAHIVLDIHRPLGVRYAPRVYPVDHRVHHRYEPLHYVAPRKHDGHRVDHECRRDCGRKSRGSDCRSDHHKRDLHRDRYVHHGERDGRDRHHDRERRREWHS
jgi:hypothetical protein